MVGVQRINGGLVAQSHGKLLHTVPFPLAARAVLVLCHARPRLFAALCGDADAAYLQGVFTVWQGVALFCQFVLRAGGEQGYRHKAYCRK